MQHHPAAELDAPTSHALELARPGGIVIGAHDHIPSERTLQRAAESVPDTTQRAREYVLREFEKWCDDNGRISLPATGATLADYVTYLAEGLDRAPATIEQAIGLIRGHHKRHGHAGLPDTTLALASLKKHQQDRAARREGQKQAPPIDKHSLLSMIRAGDLSTVQGRRDQVLLLFGWMMMARRSELVAVEHRDVTVTSDGLDVWVPKSKTDQHGAGRTSSLPLQLVADVDPIRVYQTWRDLLERLGRNPDGPLLWGVVKSGKLSAKPLSDHGVNRIVQRAALRAGVPDATRYTAHSLRAGGLVDALARGVPPGIAARHGGWDPESPMLGRYARMANRWRDNAMKAVWVDDH